MLVGTQLAPIATAKPTTGWPDRSRPTTLDEVALSSELRQRFKRYLAGDALPRSLVLHGPPGFGKTTVATIIARTLYSGRGFSRVRGVKSTETGSVDAIRNNIIPSMQALPGPRLIILEEAPGLSPEAMEALRDPLERMAGHCRAIFMTNDLAKFDEAVRSRCT